MEGREEEKNRVARESLLLTIHPYNTLRCFYGYPDSFRTPYRNPNSPPLSLALSPRLLSLDLQLPIPRPPQPQDESV